MKKVVFLIAHLGGGGAERVTTALANQFCKDGYETHLIIFDDKYNEYFVAEEIKRYTLPQEGKGTVLVLKKIWKLKHLLKIISPDVIISLGFSYRYLFFGKLMNKYQFILSERNDPTQMYGKFDLKIVKFCLKRAKTVVFQTEWAKELFEDKIQQKSVVIPNPLSDSIIPPYYGDREKRIVAYSRLNKQKNLPMMLEAFDIFHKKYPDYKLEIYGRGEMEAEMKLMAQNMNIDKYVEFMGFQKDVHEKIKNACMFISTSDYEGISNSMLEALAIGLPTLCTDCPVGGARMFIQDNQNGFLSSVGDADQFSDKMIYMVEHEIETKEIGAKAAGIRKELSIELISKKWEGLI